MFVFKYHAYIVEFINKTMECNEIGKQITMVIFT